MIILSPAYCKQATWKQSLIQGLIQLQPHHAHELKCSITSKRLSLSLYSRFELLAVLLRLSNHSVELNDDNFPVNALDFLMSTATDLDDIGESYHEIWCVAAQSLVESVMRNEQDRIRMKTNSQVKETLRNIDLNVNSTIVRELIDDFKRVLCT